MTTHARDDDRDPPKVGLAENGTRSPRSCYRTLEQPLECPPSYSSGSEEKPTSRRLVHKNVDGWIIIDGWIAGRGWRSMISIC